MKNVLIYGVCGFLGSNLAHNLLYDPNIRLLGIDNIQNNDISPIYAQLRNDNFVFQQADVRDEPEYTADEIYYLAGSGDKSEFFENKSEFCTKQIDMIKSALRYSKLSGSKIVFALDFLEFSDNENYDLYRDCAKFIESYILNSIKNENVRAKILKIPEGYGINFKKNDKRFINYALRCALFNKDIEIEENYKKNYVYIDDIIFALKTVMKKEEINDVSAIFSANEYSKSELAKLIVKCAQSNSKIILKAQKETAQTQNKLNYTPDFSSPTSLLEGIYKTVSYEKFMQF